MAHVTVYMAHVVVEGYNAHVTVDFSMAHVTVRGVYDQCNCESICNM